MGVPLCCWCLSVATIQMTSSAPKPSKKKWLRRHSIKKSKRGGKREQRRRRIEVASVAAGFAEREFKKLPRRVRLVRVSPKVLAAKLQVCDGTWLERTSAAGAARWVYKANGTKHTAKSLLRLLRREKEIVLNKGKPIALGGSSSSDAQHWVTDEVEDGVILTPRKLPKLAKKVPPEFSTSQYARHIVGMLTSCKLKLAKHAYKCKLKKLLLENVSKKDLKKVIMLESKLHVFNEHYVWPAAVGFPTECQGLVRICGTERDGWEATEDFILTHPQFFAS